MPNTDAENTYIFSIDRRFADDLAIALRDRALSFMRSPLQPDGRVSFSVFSGSTRTGAAIASLLLELSNLPTLAMIREDQIQK